MSETSSIDELLTATITKPQDETQSIQESPEEVSRETSLEPAAENIEHEALPEEGKPSVVDEYGNEKAPEKNYTQEEADEYANRIVRERLARLERNNPPTQQQAQQAAQSGFEYNSESTESWQQQLESFVEQTVSKMTQKQAMQAQQHHEQRIQSDFEQKFQSGMSKFNDYHTVVASQPVTDAMVMATRGMKDPAAFIYAASKRAPQELQRIAQIPDQYTQMVEIGKLEERMKQAKPATKTPRPLSKTQEDMTIEHKSERQPTIEELIAKEDAKRQAKFNYRRR